jgi:hypothetical protein
MAAKRTIGDETVELRLRDQAGTQEFLRPFRANQQAFAGSEGFFKKNDLGAGGQGAEAVCIMLLAGQVEIETGVPASTSAWTAASASGSASTSPPGPPPTPRRKIPSRRSSENHLRFDSATPPHDTIK